MAEVEILLKSLATTDKLHAKPTCPFIVTCQKEKYLSVVQFSYLPDGQVGCKIYLSVKIACSGQAVFRVLSTLQLYLNFLIGFVQKNEVGRSTHLHNKAASSLSLKCKKLPPH